MIYVLHFIELFILFFIVFILDFSGQEEKRVISYCGFGVLVFIVMKIIIPNYATNPYHLLIGLTLFLIGFIVVIYKLIYR